MLWLTLLLYSNILACECSNVEHLFGSRHLHLKLQKLTFQSSNHAGGKKILIIGACGNNLDIIRYQGGVCCCIVLNSSMEQCYLKIYIGSFKGNQKQEIIFELQNSKVKKTMWTFCTFENSKNLCSTYLITLKEVKISEVEKFKSTAQLADSVKKAQLRQPAGQRLSNVRTQQQKISIGPILFLYYQESLVSSNLNSKQFGFHCAHPNVHM